LPCRISLVPRTVVNTLTVDLKQLESYISSVLERVDPVLNLPPDKSFNRDYIHSAAEKLEECLERICKDDGFYDEDSLAEINNILLELIPTLNRIMSSMPNPPEPLLLRKFEYDGVFLDHDVQIRDILCKAGIFVSDDLEEKEQKRVIYHELTHAYFRANKDKLLDCPWIEEGLAEWCSGQLTKRDLPISRFAFYEFFEVFKPMQVADVQTVTKHWLRGDVPVDWWCRFVKERKLPQPNAKVTP
jgi:hypothetical protein